MRRDLHNAASALEGLFCLASFKLSEDLDHTGNRCVACSVQRRQRGSESPRTVHAGHSGDEERAETEQTRTKQVKARFDAWAQNKECAGAFRCRSFDTTPRLCVRSDARESI